MKSCSLLNVAVFMNIWVKVMIRQLALATLAVALATFTSASSFAQEWSSDEMAVWKTIDLCMTKWAQKDVVGVMQYFHPQYSGWRDEDGLPIDKASGRRNLEYSFPRFDVTFHEVKPVAITVIGEYAVAHYYYTVAGRLDDGREIGELGQATSFLVKEGGAEWLIVGEQTRSVRRSDVSG